MTLRTLITLPRMLRHGSAVGADLPPDAAVVLDPPHPRLRPALVAAAAGAHEPARDLLAQTRLGGEWEHRGAWVPRLASSALHNPGWLDDWLAAAPDDPDAALVKAGLALQQAWEIRTSARAKDVSQDQFRAFFALLDDAVPVISTAAELNPSDPVPWQLALEHATGSQSPREVFDTYWAEATARAPHHYGCHAAALQYLCDKWHGSHEEMFDFAERAAREALPGSKLHALPLLAAVEYDIVADGVAQGRAGGRFGAPAFRRRVDAAVGRALALSAMFPADDPEIADVRNHLALMLVLAGRYDEALGQFRALGTHAAEHPWGWFGDARRQFLDFRTGLRMHVAARTPFFSAPRAVLPGQRSALGAPAGQAPESPAPGTAPRSLALIGTAPHRVAEAALLARVPLRVAPAPGGATYVEIPSGTETGPAHRRAALLGEEHLVAAADAFTAGERWPVLVLRSAADRYGVVLLRRGRKLLEHEWDPAAPVPDHAAAAAAAKVLADAYDIADTRPLTALLRGSDGPERRLAALVSALGLPPLPPAFGEHDDVLAGLPGAQVLARRGRFGALRAALSLERSRLSTGLTGLGGLPLLVPQPVVPRPRRWWALRLLGLLLCGAATAYAWWSPDIGRLRACLATVATLYLTGRLTRAWRQRPRRGPRRGARQRAVA